MLDLQMMYKLSHSFNKYVLGTCCITDTILCATNIVMNKKYKQRRKKKHTSTSIEFALCWGKQTLSKLISKMSLKEMWHSISI